MLKKIKGRPLWYKIWAISVAIAAIYVLIGIFTEEGLSKFGYFLMFFTHASILLDLYFFPQCDSEQASLQKTD
jgi:hypothetical protein